MRPIVICCSQRFKEEIKIFVRFLQKRGVLVNAPNFRNQRRKIIMLPEFWRMKSPERRAKVPGMVLTHLHKIREIGVMGGLCLIYNPLPNKEKKQKLPNGYIGNNTLGEIFAAHTDGILTLMMRPHEEECIMALVPRDHKERIFALQFHSIYFFEQTFYFKTYNGDYTINELHFEPYLRGTGSNPPLEKG